MLHKSNSLEGLKNNIVNTDPAARAHFGASVGKGLMQDEVNILGTHKIPFAILHGEHDAFVSKEYLDNLKFPQQWKNKVHVIAGSGHCPQLEAAEQFNSSLSEFYKSVFK